ncbi:hypothetical protein JTE90_014467 [Oedothorax gibbosus]|uniref:Uncharacterized protein n=1 Tax=Oedothorax gibbosus TaxID=931172 RepID=A0AAV6VKP4_9ARAC|nr:hypothetical protein JTE90_014467 [Oedothorax gibbosus]
MSEAEDDLAKVHSSQAISSTLAVSPVVSAKVKPRTVPTIWLPGTNLAVSFSRLGEQTWKNVRDQNQLESQPQEEELLPPAATIV